MSEDKNFNWKCRDGKGENGSQAYVMNALKSNETKGQINWLISSFKINFDN